MYVELYQLEPPARLGQISVPSGLGSAFGTLLPYVTGGLAWGQTRKNINSDSGNIVSATPSTHVGWTVGVGLEFPIAGNWTGKIEYDYIDLGPKTITMSDAGQPGLTVDPKISMLTLGLNYRLSDLPSWASPAWTERASVPESNNWNIHGQTTFIEQAYPRFRSPYEGPNSLPGGGQGRETWTSTAFIGWRLWEGGELYFNPELNQGFGLAGTLGLAGFSNGEAQKAGSAFPLSTG